MEFTLDKNYYEILRVPNDALASDISRAKDILKYGPANHPELGVSPSEWNKIDEAYSVLNDPERRREYDEFLRRNNAYTGSHSEPSLEDHTDQINRNTETLQRNIQPSEPQRVPTPVQEPHRTPRIVDPYNVVNKSKENDTFVRKPVTAVLDGLSKAANFLEGLTIRNPILYGITFTTISTLIAGLPGFAVGAAISGLGLGIAGKKGKLKLKLQKTNKYRIITKLSTDEVNAYDEARAALDSEIEELLVKPNSNYKLSIAEKKYESDLELYKKLYEIRTNQKPKNIYRRFRQKLEVASMANQISSAEKKLNEVREEISNYNEIGKSKLQSLNQRLSREINTLNREKENPNRVETKVNKLNFYVNRLTRRRDKKADLEKFSFQMGQKFADVKVRLVSTVKAVPAIFKRVEDEEVHLGR